MRDTAMEMDVDFSVKFNWKPTSNNIEFSNVDELNSHICDLKWSHDREIPTEADYLAYGDTNVFTTVGVSTTGVLIFSSLSAL